MVDIQPTTQAISDDQELAKVLAGVSQQADDAMQFEVTPPAPLMTPAASFAPPTPEPFVAPVPQPAFTAPTPTGEIGDLDGIKKDALLELRPLIDKLTLAPEEKFDTYLLLIRSTDDKTLIAPAHEAAKEIPDETRRAQALLDVIKEIDFLSAPAQ